MRKDFSNNDGNQASVVLVKCVFDLEYHMDTTLYSFVILNALDLEALETLTKFHHTSFGDLSWVFQGSFMLPLMSSILSVQSY